MRRTIHLVQRGLPAPLRCLACGETAEMETTRHSHTPAVCANRTDWDTIYANHSEYRRCTDLPDARDQNVKKPYPVPEKPGYYWAEWRLAEDGSWPPGFDHKPSFTAEVVYVVVDIGSEASPNVSGYDWPLVVHVFDSEKAQSLENFVWRSAAITPP